jgi:hypothetical protein
MDNNKAEKERMIKTIEQSQQVAAQLQKAQADLLKLAKKQEDAEANRQKYAESLREAQETIKKQQAEIHTFEIQGEKALATLNTLREVYMSKIGEFQKNAKEFQAIIDEQEEEIEALKSQTLDSPSNDKQAKDVLHSERKADGQKSQMPVDTVHERKIDHFIKAIDENSEPEQRKESQRSKGELRP